MVGQLVAQLADGRRAEGPAAGKARRQVIFQPVDGPGPVAKLEEVLRQAAIMHQQAQVVID